MKRAGKEPIDAGAFRKNGGGGNQEAVISMKRILFSVVVVFFVFLNAQAQNFRKETGARIHAAKMAYITDRLRLTEEQAVAFAPVYAEFEAERRATRREFVEKHKGHGRDWEDDTTSRLYIDEDLDYQQRMIDLKRKYNERFLKVINPQQVAELFVAEKEFNKMLRRQMEHRDEFQGGRGGRFR